MYKHMTFENILHDMLLKIPKNFDKREGSLVYDALAPVAAELAQLYIGLDHVLDITYAPSAYGEFLDKRVAEMGLTRKKPTESHRLGHVYNKDNELISLPLYTEFIIDNIVFSVIGENEDHSLILACKEKGTLGNHPHGQMRPLKNNPLITKAHLLDILRPGEDEETDEALYRRYVSYILEKPFAGNKAAYIQAMSLLPGVGPAKVVRPPLPNGMVTICFLASDYSDPTPHLIDMVKDHFNPEKNPDTITPLFQEVVPTKAFSTHIKIDVHHNFHDEIDEELAKEKLLEILKNIETEYVERWGSTDGEMIFISHLESALYQSGLLKDVKIYLRNGRNNVLLNTLQVPRFSEVNFHAL